MNYFVFPLLFLILLCHSDIYGKEDCEFQTIKNPFFKKNIGQWDKNIKFEYSTSSLNTFFYKNKVSYSLHKVLNKQSSTVTCNWNVNFLNTNKKATIIGESEHFNNINYIISKNDQIKAYSNIPLSDKIIYKDIYNKIDLVYYHNNEKLLKYDYILKPKANVDDIQFSINNVDDIGINHKGQLVVQTALGKVVEEKPYAYQIVNNQEIEIPVYFTLINDTTVGFIIDDYNKKIALVIDPVLTWSTFVGGSGINEGFIRDIDVDTNGNTYATGYYLNSFPTTSGSLQTTNNGNEDAFIFKLSPDGDSLIYATYIGGLANDRGTGIQINDLGEAYICGTTSSIDFPTSLTAVDTSNTGGGTDAFVIKLNALGNTLMLSTFIGGSGDETANDIAIDSSGNIYVTGQTKSIDFDTLGATQDSLTSTADIFLTVINNNVSNYLFSSYIGGNSTEFANGIALNNNKIFLTGATRSSANFPLVSPIQGSLSGVSDAFIIVLDASSYTIDFSSYFGGNDQDEASAIDVDSLGRVSIVGTTQSNDLPLATSGLQTFGGIIDGFAITLNNSLTTISYSTYRGGSDRDQIYDFDIAPNGDLYVCGLTQSNNFTTTNGPSLNDIAYQNSLSGTNDIFITRINTDTNTIAYSTFIGGNSTEEYKTAIKINQNRNVTIGASTRSDNFPITTGAYQVAKGNNTGNAQPIIFRFGLDIDTPPSINIDTTSIPGLVTQNVFIPEMFSPNGDGMNDFLFANNFGYTSIDFTIFNRWGEIIFATTDANLGWDGNYKGKQQGIDNYIYIFKGIKPSGEEDIIDGSFALIR